LFFQAVKHGANHKNSKIRLSSWVTNLNLKAVLFDLHNTLVYLENPLSSEEVSEFLIGEGYEIYPQSLDAASHFVGMVDYPKHGYSSRRAFLKQVLSRLDTEIDDVVLKKLA